MIEDSIKNSKTLIHEIASFEEKVFQCKNDRFSKQSLRLLVTSPRAYCVVMRDENQKICGWVVGFMRNFKIPSGRIYKIAVREDCRNHGMGSALLNCVEDFFRSKGMKKVCAEVRESNASSLAMFKKNGYKQSGTLYAYYTNLTDGIEMENGIKHWKSLI